MAKRMIGAALIATIVASPTVAQELYPYAGQVQDEKENSYLTFQCGKQGVQLFCNFSQGRVSKPNAKKPAELDGEAGQMLEGTSDEQCAAIEGVYYKAFSDPPTLDPKPTAQELEDLQTYLTSAKALCERRDAVSARALVGLLEDRAQRTCSFSVYQFELTFDWGFETQRWETVSTPQGACGIVVAAFLEPETSFGTTFWNYHQQKIATNKAGEDPLFGKCSEYPASANRSSWKSRTIPLQCDYVKFSPF